MSHSEPDPQRVRAAALARVLEPILAKHLAEEPEAVRTEVKYVVARLDRDLLWAVKRVADAITKADQAKYDRVREVSARRELDRAARQLRTRYENREKSRVS